MSSAFAYFSTQTSGVVHALQGQQAQEGPQPLKFKPLHNILLQYGPGCAKSQERLRPPSSHSPRIEVTFLHVYISNRRKKLYETRMLCLVIFPSQDASITVRRGHISIQPLALTLSMPIVAIPRSRDGPCKPPRPEQPLMTAGQKRCAKGKGTTVVLAPDCIRLTPESSIAASELWPRGTCLYNPGPFCTICFPFGRLAIRDTMLELMSP